MKTARRRAREFVVQGLYQAQLNGALTASNIRSNLLDNEQFLKADEPLFAHWLIRLLPVMILSFLMKTMRMM